MKHNIVCIMIILGIEDFSHKKCNLHSVARMFAGAGYFSMPRVFTTSQTFLINLCGFHRLIFSDLSDIFSYNLKTKCTK